MNDWDVIETPVKKRQRQSNLKLVAPTVAEPRRREMVAEPQPRRRAMVAEPQSAQQSGCHGQRQVVIASDCAGLHTVSIALSLLSLPHRTAFMSEVDSKAMSVIMENFDLSGTSVCKDVMKRQDGQLQRLGEVDLYTAGPPCQSCSNMGLQAGIDDPRGIVFLRLLHTVRTVSPRCFIFENVAALASKPFASVLGAILATLQNLRSSDGDRAYKVRMRILDTQTHGGLPQHRKRLYIVGWKRDEAKHEFEWPSTIKRHSIDDIISAAGPTVTSFVRPKLTRRRRQILCSMHDTIRAAGGDPDRETHIVDLNSGFTHRPVLGLRRRRKLMRETCIVPCLTKTRCTEGGHWLTRQRRMMTLSELEALQGLPPGSFRLPTGVTECQFAGMIGNAFTVSVIGRVALNLLRAVGVVKETCEDIWADDLGGGAPGSSSTVMSEV